MNGVIVYHFFLPSNSDVTYFGFINIFFFQMNGKIVNGSPIKVTLARRQMMSASLESESPGDWACIGLYFCDLFDLNLQFLVQS